MLVNGSAVQIGAMLDRVRHSGSFHVREDGGRDRE